MKLKTNGKPPLFVVFAKIGRYCYLKNSRERVKRRALTTFLRKIPRLKK